MISFYRMDMRAYIETIALEIRFSNLSFRLYPELHKSFLALFLSFILLNPSSILSLFSPLLSHSISALLFPAASFSLTFLFFH